MDANQLARRTLTALHIVEPEQADADAEALTLCRAIVDEMAPYISTWANLQLPIYRQSLNAAGCDSYRTFYQKLITQHERAEIWYNRLADATLSNANALLHELIEAVRREGDEGPALARVFIRQAARKVYGPQPRKS